MPDLYGYEKKTDAVTSAAWYQNYTRFVQLRGFAERTRRTYYGWVKQLARHYPELEVASLGPDRVLDFLVHLQDERKVKASTLNQALCASTEPRPELPEPEPFTCEHCGGSLTFLREIAPNRFMRGPPASARRSHAA